MTNVQLGAWLKFIASSSEACISLTQYGKARDFERFRALLCSPQRKDNPGFAFKK